LVETSLNEELIDNFNFDLRGNSIHSSATDEHLGQSTASAESKPISVDEQLNESFATASVESEPNAVTVEVLGEEEAFVGDVEMESELIKPEALGDAQNEPMLESMVDSKEEAARVGVSAPVLGESGFFNDESLSESVATAAVVATDTVTTDNVATEADQQQELHSFAGDDLSFATPKVDNEVEAVETLISVQASEDGGSFEEGVVAAQNFGVENKENCGSNKSEAMGVKDTIEETGSQGKQNVSQNNDNADTGSIQDDSLETGSAKDVEASTVMQKIRSFFKR